MITRRRMLGVTGGLAALGAAAAGAQEKFKVPTATTLAERRKRTMEIQRSGLQPSEKGPAEYFTGSVRIDSRFQGSEPARVGGAFVTFDPGARTAWHTHPLGQTLIVTSGCGWVQCEGAAKEEIRPGDVVWIPVGEKYWHGASATTAMTHIAIAEALNERMSTGWKRSALSNTGSKSGLPAIARDLQSGSRFSSAVLSAPWGLIRDLSKVDIDAENLFSSAWAKACRGRRTQSRY